MAENMVKPAALRIAASVILGVIVGGILFLIITFFIGLINKQYTWMGIPANLLIAENGFGLGLLILLIGISIAYFWWKVETTPPSEPESPELPGSEIPDE
jgi:hypothetical protein